MDRIHVPAMEPLLRTSPRALVSRVYSVCTLFRDSTLQSTSMDLDSFRAYLVLVDKISWEHTRPSLIIQAELQTNGLQM